MTALAQRAPKLTVEDFLAFYETRPDEERWQLVDGDAIMMTPPFVTHQFIASNLQALLNDAAQRYGANRLAFQRIGIELAGVPFYRPEPDVAVIDIAVSPGQRYVDRFYLVAEVLSASDDERILLKRRYYRAHTHNRAILLIGQERIELELDRRVGNGWVTDLLVGSDAALELPEFGLSCRLGDLYRNTPLQTG